MGAGPSPVGWGQVRLDVAKAVGAKPRLKPWTWGRGQGHGCGAEVVGAWPRPWEWGQGRGGLAKSVRAWPRP